MYKKMTTELTIKTPAVQSVDEWLKDVSYKDDPTYIPSDFAIDFINFIKFVNGAEGEENTSPIMHYKMLDQIPYKRRDVANMAARGTAKALALNTPILTPTGYVPIKDVNVGHLVIDRDGKQTTVIAESSIFTKPCYRVTLSDGSSFVASEDHYNIVQRRTSKGLGTAGKRSNHWVEEELTTKEIVNLGVVSPRKITDKNPKGREIKWYIPLVSASVEFDYEKSPIDAYTVGVILGDGSVCKKTGIPKITGHIEDLPEIMSHIPYKKGEVYLNKNTTNVIQQSIKGIGLLVKNYIGIATCWTKSIPDTILFGSKEDRISIVQGLMDTDGTISKNGHTTYCSVSEALARGFTHIIKSLGGFARLKHYKNAYAGYYIVSFNLLDINPLRLKRKADLWVPNRHYKSGVRIGIQSIELIQATVKSKCISVDSPTRSFLIENCVPTRNTAVLGEYFILYLAVYVVIPNFGEVKHAVYVSDSMSNGVKKMRRRLEGRWLNSPFLRTFIPTIKFTDDRWEFINADGVHLVVGGYGVQTGFRGTVELNTRPRLAILDDLISDKDARSKTVIDNVITTVYYAVENGLHPTKRKIIWSGTPFNAGDPLYMAIESGAWFVNVFPICEEFPCKKEDFRSAWGDRFDFEAITAMYNKASRSGQINAFNQELMLRIMSEEDRLIQDCDIAWFSRPPVVDNRGMFNFYITTDFATSEENAGDYSVISVWAYNANGDWLWVDGIVKKQLMDKNVDDLFTFVQMYAPKSVGIEISGQQKGFISWVQKEMVTRNIYFNLAKDIGSSQLGIRPNTDKMSRFQIMVPMFKLNKIKFPIERKTSPEMIECISELSLASNKKFKSKHDDFIDTISMLGAMQPYKPSAKETDLKYNKYDDIWELDLVDEEVLGISSYTV